MAILSALSALSSFVDVVTYATTGPYSHDLNKYNYLKRFYLQIPLIMALRITFIIIKFVGYIVSKEKSSTPVSRPLAYLVDF